MEVTCTGYHRRIAWMREEKIYLTFPAGYVLLCSTGDVLTGPCRLRDAFAPNQEGAGRPRLASPRRG